MVIATEPDHCASGDPISDVHQHRAEIRIRAAEPATVVNGDGEIVHHRSRPGDRARLGSLNGGVDLGVEVHPPMTCICANRCIAGGDGAYDRRPE